MLNWINNLVGTQNTIANNPQMLMKSHNLVATDSKPIEEGKQEPKLKTCKLLMVTVQNNNKFYHMQEQEDGAFQATYGRVGTAGVTRSYSIAQWDKKYREKLSKGYQDQTTLFVEATEEKDECAGISELAVRNLVKQLLQYAKQTIRYHYNVDASQVSEKQLDEAQLVIDGLGENVKSGMDEQGFNEQLLKLYHIIPRKMANVKNHLIAKPKNKIDLETIGQLIYSEQSTLDVMRGQMKLSSQKQEKPESELSDSNILEAMNLQIEKVNDSKVIDSVKGMMQEEKEKFKAIYQVVSLRSEQKFQQHLNKAKSKKTELFWHGSRNENWLSIMEGGLVLRPKNAIITGKMFGYGLYFADKCRKALNYSSLRGSYWSGGNANTGFLALYKVHVGNQLKLKSHKSWCCELTAEKLKQKGENYDSLYAQGGVDLRNNEYIVYKEQQCTIQYLVEVKCS